MRNAFDDLVLQFDPAMTVVTTVSDGERAGCLVGFQAQSSIEPPRFAICLSKANHTYRVGLRAERFAVHFLGEEDLDLAEAFGTLSGDRVDKFAMFRWTKARGGVPVLDRCPNHFLARRIALLDAGGDHVVLITEPSEAEFTGAFRPLRLSQVVHLEPGREHWERPQPSLRSDSD